MTASHALSQLSYSPLSAKPDARNGAFPLGEGFRAFAPRPSAIL